MDSAQEAIANFERLGFYIASHDPYEAPRNDPEEILKLQNTLREGKISPKEEFLVRAELELQTNGSEELVEARQFFDSFKGMIWESNVQPYTTGYFFANKGEYALHFLARAPEKITDMEEFFDFFGVNFFHELDHISEGKELSDRIRKAAQSISGIRESVEISPGRSSLLMPPFSLTVRSQNIDQAYGDLTDAMQRVGYREGVVHKIQKKE